MKLELSGGWTVADYGDEVIRQTSGPLRIVLGDRAASLVVDNRSNTTREEIRVAFYPLALWFASSWWRLRWEPENADLISHTTSWRMAHEMAAAGLGYTWPRMSFRSDGETIEVTSIPSDPSALQPVRYLLGTNEILVSSDFERIVDNFVDFVVARLDDVGVHNTDLHRLWSDVLSERRDKQASEFRRVEAQLGFDPDDAPVGLVDTFIGVSTSIGKDAMSEVASACAGYDPGRKLSEIHEASKVGGISAELAFDPKSIVSDKVKEFMPWERGYKLASSARDALGISSGPISDELLGDLFKVSASIFKDDSCALNSSQLSLAVRDKETSYFKLLFHRKVYESRRFEAARFLADCISASESDYWYPVTDFRTARQKLQRAFAAELLCPIADLREFLDGDYSDERLNEAGAHFLVSPLIVELQRDNRLLHFGQS